MAHAVGRICRLQGVFAGKLIARCMAQETGKF